MGSAVLSQALMSERLFDERFARRALDGGEHARVGDALPAQSHDQLDGARIAHRCYFANASRSFSSTSSSVRLRCSGVTEMRFS